MIFVPKDREANVKLLDEFAGRAMQALIHIGAHRVAFVKAKDGPEFQWPDEPLYFGHDPLGDDDPKEKKERRSPSLLAMHAYEIAAAMMSVRWRWLEDGMFDDVLDEHRNRIVNNRDPIAPND